MNKTTLILRDNSREDTFQYVSYHLCYQLVTNIKKRDREKYVEGIGSLFLGDEGKEGRINVAPNFLTGLGFQN